MAVSNLRRAERNLHDGQIRVGRLSSALARPFSGAVSQFCDNVDGGGRDALRLDSALNTPEPSLKTHVSPLSVFLKDVTGV
jgi:hypothetical protein